MYANLLRGCTWSFIFFNLLDSYFVHIYVRVHHLMGSNMKYKKENIAYMPLFVNQGDSSYKLYVGLVEK